jgi:hypothetical protein
MSKSGHGEERESADRGRIAFRVARLPWLLPARAAPSGTAFPRGEVIPA